jgi:hypothetical protein
LAGVAVPVQVVVYPGDEHMSSKCCKLLPDIKQLGVKTAIGVLVLGLEYLAAFAQFVTSI